MNPSRGAFFTAKLAAVLASSVGIAACVVDEIPACPGQCFDYTVQVDTFATCHSEEFEYFAISFTGTDPDGYRGRVCLNSPSVPLAVEAIELLRTGTLLAELNEPMRDAYLSIVDAVRDDLRSECITAAPGQCINEIDVCTGIAADMYEQVVVQQSCVLGLGGIEPVVLGPGQVCGAISPEGGAGSGDDGEHCTEPATSGSLDETASGSEGADETGGGTTGMVAPVDDLHPGAG